MAPIDLKKPLIPVALIVTLVFLAAALAFAVCLLVGSFVLETDPPHRKCEPVAVQIGQVWQAPDGSYSARYNLIWERSVSNVSKSAFASYDDAVQWVHGQLVTDSISSEDARRIKDPRAYDE